MFLLPLSHPHWSQLTKRFHAAMNIDDKVTMSAGDSLIPSGRETPTTAPLLLGMDG